MDRERVDNWCEKGVLGLVAAMLVFGPLATGAVRTLELLIIQGAMICALGLAAARFWLGSKDRLLWPPVLWVVLAFILYAIARYFQADLEYPARSELIRILIYGFLFLLIVDQLYRQEHLQTIVFALVFLGMAISLYAVYQYLTGSIMVWHFIKPAGYHGRGSGTYISPNHLAGFLGMVLPLGLATVFVGRYKPLTKVFLGYACLAMAAGLAVSLSRAGWIASGTALLLFFLVLLRHQGRRLPAILGLIVLLGGATWFFKENLKTQQRINLTFESGQASDVRLRIWKSALLMWQDHPWWGVGPGQFDHRFRPYRQDDIQSRPLHVHNDYLQTLAEWGVAGGTLVLAGLILLGAGLTKTWKYVQKANEIRTKPSNRSALVLGSALGLTAILAHSIFDFNLQIPANAMVAIALMAILTAHIRFATERYWVRLTLPVQGAATLILAAGMVYLGYQLALRAREYAPLERVEQLKMQEHDPLDRIQLLKKAFAVEPSNFEVAYEIGETLRLIHWMGMGNYQEGLKEAMEWFEKGMQLNPYDPYNHLRYGMCLHVLGRSEEASKHIHKSLALDPKNFYFLAHAGWHEFQLENFVRARELFLESLHFSQWRHSETNIIALSYLRIIQERGLAELNSVP
jgi:O-antigen ligase